MNDGVLGILIEAVEPALRRKLSNQSHELKGMRNYNMNAFKRPGFTSCFFLGGPGLEKQTCIVGDYSVSFVSGNKRLAVPSAYCGFDIAILGQFPISQGHGRDAPKWIPNSAVTLLVGNLK